MQVTTRLTGGRMRRTATGAMALAVALSAAPLRAEEEARMFETPEAAVAALLEAVRAKDRAQLQSIFGPAVSELVSGDEVQDRQDFEEFAQRLTAANSLSTNEDGGRTLHVGTESYPFPIPLATKEGRWYFDTDAGTEEILNRRIGENELQTIAVCRAFVEAQREYFLTDWDGDGVLEYAQRLMSTAGQKDGLYWETAAGEAPSPMGALVAQARDEGYGAKGGESASASASGARPYHGYVYRLLNGQSGAAPGGAFEYVIHGNMVAGFALLAYPVEYGDSGIMTFLVNANGTVLEKDLGEKTGETARGMTSYAADKSWAAVKD